MKKGFFKLLILCPILLFSDCKKNNSVTPSTGAPIVQGNVTLAVNVMHHYWGVSFVPVYIKFNTKDWPGKDTTKYDLRAMTDHDGSVIFNHFGPGDFVIYSAGYDSIWGGNVLGYNTWSITKADANSVVYATVVASEKF